jgi:phenylpropionate dioxygenase-like ring-hydroxylating dioxygenase large terminal subunit
MARPPFTIDPDIRRASTLPAWCYSDTDFFARIGERVFARSWQLVADTDRVRVPGWACPVTFLEDLVPEPLLLTRDGDDRLHCLSNVCTHRGNLVCEHEGAEAFLRCRYHGRRFALDGRFLSMPEFDQVEQFPTDADHLRPVRLGTWEKLLFAALDPSVPFDDYLAPVRARCGWMPLDRATLDPTRSRDYLVRANWALYCDNYLEGFHIPYVHHGLSGALDYANYRTELFAHANLQVGIASSGEDVFDLPPGSPDHGQRVAGYYFWLFPNLMLNFYPWGLSINIVKPLAVDRTKVTFLSYVWDASRLDRGAGASLDRVEREDEQIVETVQRGVRSRIYERGRYSVAREACVHHFHRLLAHALSGDATA